MKAIIGRNTKTWFVGIGPVKKDDSNYIDVNHLSPKTYLALEK